MSFMNANQPGLLGNNFSACAIFLKITTATPSRAKISTCRPVHKGLPVWLQNFKTINLGIFQNFLTKLFFSENLAMSSLYDDFSACKMSINTRINISGVSVTTQLCNMLMCGKATENPLVDL